MSFVKDIPVYYAFEHASIDIDCLVEAVRSKYSGTKKSVLYWRVIDRTVYLAYDLAYTHCIRQISEAIQSVCSHVVCGVVKHSQNLEDSEYFGDGYTRAGYLYFPVDSFDSEGILLFVAKDGITVTNYTENGNVYSILIDTGILQASVYSDYELKTVVGISMDYSNRI